ncbi:MAG: M48 family metalloprotease [Bernardetiaceae bacterium]|nr:M48 family metalloprotease [Bernardetiaceae bacterium]
MRACLWIALLLPLTSLTNPFFSLQDEIKLGEQVSQEVEKDPKNRVLDEKKYAAAYGHMRRITDAVLNSGEVRYRKEFPWRVKIIQNDTILNAFCAPGGFIYVYTGIIKYLDDEDQLAGVMAHEIAHADRRHATSNLVKMYGVSALMGIVLGQRSQGQVAQIAQGLLGLNFSRKHEREADDYSVIYLCKTRYQSNGAAGFFGKMLRENKGGGAPEFLSTHPSSSNRVRDINAKAEGLKCSTKPSGGNSYQQFKNSLPK